MRVLILNGGIQATRLWASQSWTRDLSQDWIAKEVSLASLKVYGPLGLHRNIASLKYLDIGQIGENKDTDAKGTARDAILIRPDVKSITM